VLTIRVCVTGLVFVPNKPGGLIHTQVTRGLVLMVKVTSSPLHKVVAVLDIEIVGKGFITTVIVFDGNAQLPVITV
jgi:hypothetical protein